ncbi:fungal-specific transcription factor domain-containing protein [Favolaschia claudopus]|uniref:Fungal-specific transcription factor domain-containing protein n=1 Tax=Favolaschia claudopus TaxID=2862362 RepID=A0AAW0ASC2_9AGAR
MPSAPKSPQAKKPGAPKAKGAVRAKSGCYTCRIRRKKCDERQNEHGHCDTCVRLRLECLGFGAKRPDWLRETTRVNGVRDKIKGFLASQGMIKGHSGASHRGPEPGFLALNEDSTPSSSESPPTPTLTLSPTEPPRRLQPHESAMRDQPGFSYDYNVHSHLRGVSPFGGSAGSHPDMYPPTFHNSPDSIAAWPQHGIANQSQAVVHGRFPVYASSFSDTYHARIEDEDMLYALPIVEDDCSMVGNAMVVNNVPLSALFNMQYFPSKPGGANDELVTHYLGNVMELQYLLADRNQIQSILIPSVTSPSAAQNAARLLAAIHSQRATYRSHSFIALQDKNTARQYEELLQVLHKTRHDEDDALAAISIISSFLFDGGSGAWQAWLKVSYDYARSIFHNRDPQDVLQTCSERTRFIIKTAIWFDVLAAVTTQESPRFIRYIRDLYSPEKSAIYDPALPSPPALSMLSVMGCENQIVWALAEASDLAVWKRLRQDNGSLSMPELVQRGTNLERYLTAKPSLYPSTTPKTEKEIARELSSNIFRAATLVYVRSIVSGDFPHVPEIVLAIDETMGYARTTERHEQKVYSSVVRSTVFAFFICGALSDDPQVQKQVEELLSLSGEDPALSTMGNATSIRRLLDNIWADRRETGACAPVPWRDVLKDANMLLV